jgi:hypothetical protein
MFNGDVITKGITDRKKEEKYEINCSSYNESQRDAQILKFI